MNQPFNCCFYRFYYYVYFRHWLIDAELFLNCLQCFFFSPLACTGLKKQNVFFFLSRCVAGLRYCSPNSLRICFMNFIEKPKTAVFSHIHTHSVIHGMYFLNIVVFSVCKFAREFSLSLFLSYSYFVSACDTCVLHSRVSEPSPILKRY